MARIVLEPAKILERVDAGSTLRLAQALIRIPSVNPPGEEAAVSEYLAEYLARAGLVVEVNDVLPRRPNVVATAEFGDGGPTLLLNGHTDVVAVGDGWDGDPFSGAVRDGKLYGRGSADMKGPLMIEAVLAVKRSARVRRGRVVVTAVMGEEYGGLGTKDLVRRGLRADHAIVGEPSELLPVIAHKGTVRFEIVVDGKACPSPKPRPTRLANVRAL